MSNSANTATTPTSSATTPTKSSTSTSEAKGADDTKSITSETSTLYEANDNKKADATKDTKKANTLGASSTAFAKKAKEQGWAAPTATRPSFGW